MNRLALWVLLSLAALPAAPRAEPAAPVVVSAKEISAKRVRARVVYAKELVAKESRVKSVVRDDSGWRSRPTVGELERPEVVADVIYVQELETELLEADEVHVGEASLGERPPNGR